MATRKPRQSRSKVTVDTIIEAGFIAVATNGTSGTTTRHIADIAGVSVGSLYEYFKNKEEIYDAMAKTFVKEVLDMVKELTPIIIEQELEPLFQMIFYTFRDLLTRDDDRYLICLRYATELKYEKYIGQIEMALMEVLMKYMIRHPRYLKVNNLSVTAYISINSSIFNVARHLILPNPQISFDEMVKGLSTMIISYIETELARAERETTLTHV
ncbi:MULTISPECIES: TetR/AcrR family transcriptional regulator [Acinetobacter]|uniref:TetR/AcrR family transcriptional regulator n=1 Tax=Acinetobacter TaxID=469 RepID=UPI000235D898|nr:MULTISPECIES: TetR/AcrR family transcriptional regulator [Acinetobacter]KXZ70928.1 HTH-type transcriptional regulator BetI [Acinetobacter venetianus]GAB02710.1 putative TetR family transcriptional regulator [Acinetobacter sp. NBRC 100985]